MRDSLDGLVKKGEIMIIGIEGAMGTGKTIMMVRYLLLDYKKKSDIYCNFALKNIEYKPLDVIEILKLDKNKKSLSNISIGIDEITVFIDSRVSSSVLNRLFSYFILQTRKRNVVLYYTTQDIMMVDLRLRRHTDFIVECDFVFHEDDSIHPIENLRKYDIWDFRNPRSVRLVRSFIMDITKYFDYYDTNEVILPPILNMRNLKKYLDSEDNKDGDKNIVS